VADESNDAVHAIKNNNDGTYTVTQSILSHVATESVSVIPNPRAPSHLLAASRGRATAPSSWRNNSLTNSSGNIR